MFARKFFVAVLVMLFFVFLTLSAHAQGNGSTVELDGEASIEIADDFERQVADIRYYLVERDKKTGKTKKRTRLHFKGDPPGAFKTGKKVKVKGRKKDDGVEVENVTEQEPGSAAGASAEAPVATPTEKRILTILVDFNDASVAGTGNGATLAQVRDRMYNETKDVEGLLYNASLGTLTIDDDVDNDGAQDVFGPYQINANYLSTSGGGSCSPATWADLASQKWIEANPDKDINDWQHRLFIVPNYWDYNNRLCTWGGVAQLGCGTWCWAFGADPESIMHGVIIHELGHNFGFNHARTDVNNDGSAICEYCDSSDLMGGSRNWMKFNAPHAEDMGWIDPVDYEIRSVTPGATPQAFDLIAMDEESDTWPGLRALKIARTGNTQYYFSWRRQAGEYDNVTGSYANRVNVHYGFTGSTYSYFVRALEPGGVFVDENAGFIFSARDVVVVDESGSSTSVIGVDVCSLDCAVLPYPTNLVAQGDTPNSIRLTWNDNSFTEEGFEIERSSDGNTWAVLDSTGADTESYTDTGLAENTTWWYRVRAYEGSNDSGWSNQDNGTTLIASGVTGIRISSNDDDVEEFTSDGYVWFNSSFINLGLDTTNGAQQEGLRFTGIPVPRGATVNNAYIQFRAVQNESGSTTARFRAESIDNAPPFQNQSQNLSSRTFSDDSVQWAIGGWSGGSLQNSPALTALVQQLINRPGWNAGNAMVFKINRISGNGAHLTWSHNGSPANAAQLFIDYSWAPPGNNPPTADFSWSNSDLAVSFTDASSDSDGNVVAWAWDFGDGNASTDQNPGHSYAAAGTYTVELTVTDNDGGNDVSTQSVTVTEQAPECSMPMAIVANEWKMFGLPCAPIAPLDTVEAVFSALNPDNYLSAWFLIEIDNATQAETLLQLDDRVSPGKFYALYAFQDASVIIEGNHNAVMDFSLNSAAKGSNGGWTFLGYTGTASLDLSALIPLEGFTEQSWDWADRWQGGQVNDYHCNFEPDIGTACRIRRTLQVWNGSAFQVGVAGDVGAPELQPMDVIAVRAFAPDVGLRMPQSLSNPPVVSTESGLAEAPGQAGGNGSQASGKLKLKKGEWAVRLIAGAGRHKDRGNLFGQLRNSAPGQDARDLEELTPISPNYLTVLFENSELEPVSWGYSTDFRDTSKAPRGEWNILVRYSAGMGEVTLRWQALGSEFPAMRLVDNDTGTAVDMQRGGQHSFNSEGTTEKRFRLIVD